MKSPLEALRMAHRSAQQQGTFGFLSAEGSAPEAVGSVFRKEHVRLWGQAVDLRAQRRSVLWAWGAGWGTWLVSGSMQAQLDIRNQPSGSTFCTVPNIPPENLRISR